MSSIQDILNQRNIKPIIESIDNAFRPNRVTDALVNAIPLLGGRVQVLDIGSGIGPLGIKYALANPEAQVVCSEYQQSAVTQAKKNIELNGLKNRVIALQSDVYEKITGKFDAILDDISGISSSICDITSWYEGVPSIADRNGTNLVLKVINNAKNYLKKQGKLYIPTGGLSKEEDLLNAMNKTFRIEQIYSRNMPFCPELTADLNSKNSVLKQLREEGIIKFEEKGTRGKWKLNIWECVLKN